MKHYFVEEMDEKIWSQLAEDAKRGKLIAFPTETVYGVGGPASDPETDRRLRELKGRSWDKPFSFHIASWKMFDSLGLAPSEKAETFIRKMWPGPVTVILRDAKGQKTGVRFPSDPVAIQWIESIGEPLLATSANPSGTFSPCGPEEVENGLGEKLDGLIDADATDLEEDSTVVDLSGESPRILRKGAMLEEIAEALEEIYE